MPNFLAIDFQEGQRTDYFRCAAWILPLGLLAGCASSSPPPAAADTAAAWQETTGTGTTTEHTSVQKYNNQILQSEHAMDADAPAIPDGENHGLP